MSSKTSQQSQSFPSCSFYGTTEGSTPPKRTKFNNPTTAATSSSATACTVKSPTVDPAPTPLSALQSNQTHNPTPLTTSTTTTITSSSAATKTSNPPRETSQATNLSSPFDSAVAAATQIELPAVTSLASFAGCSPFRPAFKSLKVDNLKPVEVFKRHIKITNDELKKITIPVEETKDVAFVGDNYLRQPQSLPAAVSFGPAPGPQSSSTTTVTLATETSSVFENETNNLNESPSLDRDSPIPLKNLGNTCYENSIIQCLFSLTHFMDNFEVSMEKIRNSVIENVTSSSGFEDDAANHRGFESTVADLSNTSSSTTDSCTDDHQTKSSTKVNLQDVRYRIANAFQKLYHSYTNKRLLVASNDVTKTSQDVIIEDPLAVKSNIFPKDHNSDIHTNEPSSTNSFRFSSALNIKSEDLTSATSSNFTQQTPAKASSITNLTPIALVSNSSNEQSEIETRLDDLKSAVGERSSQFNSTHQQDASEFFYHVIDSIQEFYQSLNNDEDDPVTKSFELELDYLISCPKCLHRSYSQPEKIRTLPLALPSCQEEGENVSENKTKSQEASVALTPPSSDLGLDSPTSSHDDARTQDHSNSSDEKENKAIDVSCSTADKSLGSSAASKSQCVSMSKLELSDKEQPPQPKRFTLADALNNYFKDDLIDYKCSQSGCDSKQRNKKCLIRKLPEVLFITLARYSYTGKKNLDKVDAPFELSVPLKENKSPSHSPSAHRKITEDKNKYKLVAVVCHLGSSLNAGHYTSYVYNQNNDSWYSCDDDSITKVNKLEVQTDASKSGYCFFYVHESNLIGKSVMTAEKSTIQGSKEKEQPMVMDPSALITPVSSPVAGSVCLLDEHVSQTTSFPDHQYEEECQSIDDWS